MGNRKNGWQEFPATDLEIKRPKTYEEQLAIIKEKGFDIDQEDSCISFLHRANYYRVSAFFLPFLKKDGTYFPNIKFSQIQRIYEFDGRMRALLFQCIEEIEFYIRTQLAYFSAHKHGALGYMDKSNFSDKHKEEKFLFLIGECIEENKRTLVVRHHKEKYNGKFPIWVMIEFFSMGMLSYFYGDMKTEDQKILAKEMYHTTPSHLISWLRCLTDLRNRCAHYSRLYYWLFPAMPKIPKNVDFEADRRLFSQIMMLKFMYPEHERWNTKPLNEIDALIEEFAADISLRHIGFPENWKTLLMYE